MLYQGQKSILLLKCLYDVIIQSIPGFRTLSKMTFVTFSKGLNSVDQTLNTKNTMFDTILGTFQLLALYSCISMCQSFSAINNGICSLERVRRGVWEL